MSTGMIVNKARVKRFTKDWCAAHRPKFTRVSNEFVERMDARLKVIIADELHRMPSKGKTVQ